MMLAPITIRIGYHIVAPMLRCDAALSMRLGWQGGRNEFGPYTIPGIPCESVGGTLRLICQTALSRPQWDLSREIWVLLYFRYSAGISLDKSSRGRAQAGPYEYRAEDAIHLVPTDGAILG